MNTFMRFFIVGFVNVVTFLIGYFWFDISVVAICAYTYVGYMTGCVVVISVYQERLAHRQEDSAKEMER